MGDFFKRWRDRHPSDWLLFSKRLWAILYFPHSRWPHLLFIRYPAGYVEQAWARILSPLPGGELTANDTG